LTLLLYLHERTQVLNIIFQHYHVTQRLVVHTTVLETTRPKVWDQDWDRSASGLVI